MQRNILSIITLLSFVICITSGCGTSNDKADSMKSKQDNKPTGVLQSDPKFHKNNSVLGEIKSGGKPVPTATVTIIATKESFPVDADGFYLVVLDPAKLGNGPKELLFSAPGFVDQRRYVSVPENMQVRRDIELAPAK
jgi:hypothetical protein